MKALTYITLIVMALAIAFALGSCSPSIQQKHARQHGAGYFQKVKQAKMYHKKRHAKIFALTY